ncbi:MAG: hypothetical protein JNG83_00770 [Opitutaceae bacterium]|nr:hypothetical protein [Opitutaceae bacterium]
MNRDHALYFPYINVPSSAWFTQALLYWDSVRTIVPTDFRNSQFELNEYTRAVLEEGLVESLFPPQYLYRIPAFRDEFIGLLERHLQNPAFRRRIARRTDVASVHVQKLNELVTELQHRKLATAPVDGWVKMPGWLANLFMTYLAASLGQVANCDTTPITNQPECWAHLAGSAITMADGGDARLQLPRDQILAIALPVPATLPDPKTLAAFKRKHRPLLRRLRLEVEAAAAAVSTAKSPVAQKAILQRARVEIDEQIAEVMDAMRSKWKVVLWKTLAALPAGFGAGKAFTGAPVSATEAGFAALSALMAVQQAMASAEAHDRVIRGAPYAYAAAYRVHLGLGRRG